jgi:hypothetical protein
MLVRFGYRKVGKYNRKYEDIIDGEGFFDEVSCEKFESFFLSKPLVNKSIEHHSKWYPYGRPSKRLFHAHFLTLSVKDSEIKRKHKKDKNIKPNPEPDIDFHME